MGTNGDSAQKTADQRHDEFARKNAAWDKRVKDALSELDKVVDRPKRALRSIRRAPA